MIVDSPGFPIGLAEEPYEERCLHLAEGDRLYLYSDGLPDAMNRDGERFGHTLLLEAIRRGKTEPLGDGIADLLEEIARWRGGERVHDDTSILAVALEAVRKPNEPGPQDAAPGIAEPAFR